MITKFKIFEVSKIKWYKKGKFEKPIDIENDINDVIIKKGDRFRIVNKKNCFYDEDNSKFRDTQRGNDNLIVTARKDDTFLIYGHICVDCATSGYYKLECLEKIEK